MLSGRDKTEILPAASASHWRGFFAPRTGHAGVVSLIEREPAIWYVCFVPPLNRQWWHPFFHDVHKHCFAIKAERDGWLLFEPWWSRILLSHITDEEADRFFAWARLGNVLKVTEAIPGHSSQCRLWMSCAALVSHMLGKQYKVWTPHSLYKRLREEAGVVEIAPGSLFHSADEDIGELSLAPAGLPVAQADDQRIFA
jgi:hypothetical protein